MSSLIIVYAANIILVSWVSITSLFFPKIAKQIVFANAYNDPKLLKLVGSLYISIFLLSLLGLFFPLKMSVILLYQLIYKFVWIVAAGLPAMFKNYPYPKLMAVIFVIYLIVLPFIIPWGYLFT